MGAAPLTAKRKSPKPTAAFNFPLKTLDSPGIFKPIYKINLESMAAFKFEYIFSYILGTEIKRWGWTSFA